MCNQCQTIEDYMVKHKITICEPYTPESAGHQTQFETDGRMSVPMRDGSYNPVDGCRRILPEHGCE